MRGMRLSEINKFARSFKTQGIPHNQGINKEKVGEVMHEFKKRKLHMGKSGKIVKNKRQAIAIAMSEAGLSKKGGKRHGKG